MNNIGPTNLLDQKRNRMIDTDIDDLDLKPAPLSSMARQVNYDFFTPQTHKKFSVDFNEHSLGNNQGGIFCNCKNSQCLKRYCECFTRMKYCNPAFCTCKNCCNTLEHEVIKKINIYLFYRKREMMLFNYICRSLQ